MTSATLLIVDDEKSTRDGLRMALEDEFDCYLASDITEAMRRAAESNPSTSCSPIFGSLVRAAWICSIRH